MAQNYKAGLIITGDASGGIRAIKATDSELSKLNQGFDRSSRDSRRFGNDAERAGQQVREIGHGSTEASKGLTLVRQAATLAMAAFSIRQIGVYADNWSELNSRVLNTTKDINVSEQTMGRLAQTARDTYSGLNLTAEAYLNNATTLTELGYSTERQLDLSDALNNSLVISATRGQKASSVMDALSKSFADGQLRGDNFNTVIQSGGRIAEALAAGLGVTTIELRKMASEGELTTSRVFEALTSQMAVLREEAAAMPATIEDGFTLIGNSAMELVGRVDKAFGTSEGIAGIMIDAADAMSASIDPLIGNMDTIQDVAVLTATVVAGRYAAAFAESSKRVATNTVETVANTRANVAATTAARAKAAEVLRVAQAEQAAASRALANGHAIAAATGNTTLRSKAITQMAAANQRAIAAEAAHTAAVNANAVAMQRSTVSAYAMAAASRAASGALALVGGPLGAAILAGTAAYYFRDSLGFTSAAAREAKQDIDQLVDSLDNYTHAQYQNNRVSIVQDLAEARVEAEKLQRQIDELQEQSQQQGMWYQGHSGSATDKIAELMPALREQNRIVAANEEGLKKYDQAWRDVLESQVTGVSIFRTLDQWLLKNGDSALETSRRFNSLDDVLGEGGEKWDDYIAKLQAARDVMGMTAAESAQYAAVQQGFTGLYAEQAAAVAGQTDALNDYKKAVADGNSTEAEAHLARAQRYAEAEAMVTAQLANIGTLTNLLQGVQTELSATALSAALVVGDSAGAMAANVSTAIQAINDRAAAIRQTTTVTVKNTAANREATKAAREAEQAAEAQASALRSLQEEMDPLLRDHATYIDRVNVLEQALAAGTITQEAFAEAIRWSAEQYTRAASGAEDYEKQTESLVGKYDSLNQRGKLLRNELELINQRYRAGIYDGDQYARMVGNVRKEMDELANGSATASDSIVGSFTTWGTIADNTLRSLDDSGRDAWLGLIDGSTSALDTVERAFEQTIANILHMLTTQKLTFHVAGFMGLDTTGMPGGGGFNLGSMGSLKSGWDTVSGLWGGSSAASTAAAGYGATGWAGSATGAYGGWAGSAAAGAAQTGGGFMAGAGAAMPWIGAGLLADNVLGLGITDGIVKGIGKLFGGGKTNPHLNIDTRADAGSYGHESVRTGAFGAVGFGQGTRRSNDLFGGIPEEREFLAAIAASDDLLASLARSPEELEAMASAVQGVRLSASDVDGVMAQLTNRTVAAVSALDGEFGEFVAGLGGDVDTIIARTQSAVGALNLLGSASENLNLQFDASADGALRAADSIAQMAGGVDQLATLQDSYYQAFFSEAERAADLQREVASAMGEMGYALPATHEGFRQLIEQQNRLTESGQRNYVQLLQLAGPFDQLQTMLEQTGTGVGAFADRLSELNGEIGTLESEVRNAYAAFEKQSFDQQLQLLGLLGDEQAALALQRERELLSIDPLLHETQRVIWSIEDETQAKQGAVQAAQNYVSELARVRDELSNTLGGISQWIDQRNATSQTPGLNLTEAGEQFARQLVLAESGDRSALQSITQYADQYLSAGEAMYASGGAFQSIQEDVLGALKDLPNQISSEEYLAQEIRDALQQAVEQLPGGIASSLHPLFDSIDLDASGLIDWDEFYGVFQGMASDEELRRIFAKLDADGSGTISRLEALTRSSDGTEDNTKTLDERARDQLDSLNGLVGEMTRTTDQFVGLNSTMVSLKDSINALGVAQAEVAKIEKARVAAEQAERDRIEQERQEAARTAQINSNIDGFVSAANIAEGRAETLSARLDPRDAGNISRLVDNRMDDGQFTHKEWEDMLAHLSKTFGSDSLEYLFGREYSAMYRNQTRANEERTKLDGSHANGNWNVAFDGYIAELHEDEMVVPARTANMLRDLPSRGLPMPDVPLPQFPALGNNDVLQVLQDVKRELQESRKETKRLQEENNRLAAAAVAVQQAGFNGQISEQKKSNLALDDMSAAARLEGSR